MDHTHQNPSVSVIKYCIILLQNLGNFTGNNNIIKFQHGHIKNALLFMITVYNELKRIEAGPMTNTSFTKSLMLLTKNCLNVTKHP